MWDNSFKLVLVVLDLLNAKLDTDTWVFGVGKSNFSFILYDHNGCDWEVIESKTRDVESLVELCNKIIREKLR